MFKILFFGDIVGKTGRRSIARILPRLREELKPDLVIANAENAAHGIGITSKIAGELYAAGCDVLTTGNHIFDKSEQAAETFRQYSGRIVRPANFEGDYPGDGWLEIDIAGRSVAVANFNGQVFMEKQFRGLIASPFSALDKFLHAVEKCSIIIIDFHAEATSEKRAFGFHADGRASLVVGTHTHIQTNDAQVLPGGTAYISDLGMTGAADSILGVKRQSALNRFLTGSGAPLDVDEGDRAEVGYIFAEIDEQTGRAASIFSRVERFPLS